MTFAPSATASFSAAPRLAKVGLVASTRRILQFSQTAETTSRSSAVSGAAEPQTGRNGWDLAAAGAAEGVAADAGSDREDAAARIRLATSVRTGGSRISTPTCRGDYGDPRITRPRRKNEDIWDSWF